MNIIFFILTASVCLANNFELHETPRRFRLVITSTEVSYSSESFSENIKLSTCSLPLAQELNREMLMKSSLSKGQKGLRIDGGPDTGTIPDDLRFRMLQFFRSIRKSCP